MAGTSAAMTPDRWKTNPLRSLSRERGCDRLMVAERQHLLADDLASFMALARDQQRVARADLADRRRDRFAPIANLDRAGSGGENRGANRGRIFAARIVVGHH